MLSWLTGKEKKKRKDEALGKISEQKLMDIIENRPTLRELIGHPHRTLIIGRSKSGKTTLAVALLYSGYIDEFEVVYWFCSTIYDQHTYDILDDYIDDNLVWDILCDDNLKEMMDVHESMGRPKALLVIDDQSSEIAFNKGNKGVFADIVTRAPWINISILCICHKVTAVSPMMRENAEHVILLYLGSNYQKNRACMEFNFMKKKHDFEKIYREAVEMTEHGCLHFDTRPPVTLYPNCQIPEEVIKVKE